jgi:hypothetical protein
VNDLEARVAASLHAAGDGSDVPESDLTDVFVRTRRRNTARRLVATTVVVVVLVVGGLVFLRRGDGSDRRVRPVESPSTVVPGLPAARPVLDGCTTASADTAVIVGGSADPGANRPVYEEVFADPAQGISGPLVIFQRGSGALLRTGDGEAGGAKIANGSVNGRDADVEFYGTHGGVVWDASSGGASVLFEQGLSEEEMRAMATALDAGTTALPQGLVSVGMTDTATVSRSTCYNQQGQSATITKIRGNQASRYREAFFSAPATARRFDHDDATIVIDGIGGNFDTSAATYHEATPAEWREICLSAGSSCHKNPPSKGTTTTTP